MANKAKIKCVVCNKKKGKRNCRINDDSLICPLCCAEIRTADCFGCQFYNQAGKFAKDKLLKQTIVIIPEVEECIDEALELLEAGKLAAGKEIISEQFKEYPHIALVQYAMSTVCLAEDRHEEALPYLNKAIELNPFMLEAYYNKAMVYYNAGTLEGAIIALRQIIEIGAVDNPVVVEARAKLVDLASFLKEHNNNLTLDEYIDSSNHFNMAFNELSSDNWEQAIAGFEKVLAINSKHVQSYGNIGIAYMQLNRRAEAIKALETALKLDPGYEPAMMHLEHINSCQGDLNVLSENCASVEYYKLKADARRAAEKTAEAASIGAETIETATIEPRELSETKSKNKPKKIGLLNRLFRL
jgi:tetratricopeptide (TPR) repeat protein